MYAREFLESGNVIKANRNIYMLRITRYIYLFLWVTVLAFHALLYAGDIIYDHGAFVAKNPIPPSGFFILLFAFLQVMCTFQERYWKHIESRRFAAALGERALLADEQPWLEGVPMLLSPFIKLRRSKEFLLLMTAMAPALALLIVLLFTGTLTLDNDLLLFFVPFLMFAFIPLGIIFAICLSLLGQQKITVTESGVAMHEGLWTHTVMWHEARLFAMYNTLGAHKSGAAITYELSSAKDIVRWTWVLRKTYWVGLEPTIPHDEYNRQMQALLSFVTAKTGLPLYDLREDLPKGEPKD